MQKHATKCSKDLQRFVARLMKLLRRRCGFTGLAPEKKKLLTPFFSEDKNAGVRAWPSISEVS